MRIKFKGSISGMSYSYHAGQEADWKDEAEARRFIEKGIAIEIPASFKPGKENTLAAGPAEREVLRGVVREELALQMGPNLEEHLARKYGLKPLAPSAPTTPPANPAAKPDTGADKKNGGAAVDKTNANGKK